MPVSAVPASPFGTVPPDPDKDNGPAQHGLTLTGQSEVGAPLRHAGLASLRQPDLPRHVAEQLAAALRASTEKSADILLNPAELGRVRISLQTGETGVIVSVMADRPETLDLMRRNADLLAQEFREIGYGKTEFSFGQGNGTGAGQGGDGDNATRPSATPAPDDSAIPSSDGSAPPRAMTTDRVDIRL